MNKYIALIMMILLCPFLEAANLVVPKGTLVKIRLIESVTTKTAKVGKLVKFTVDRAVLVGKKKIVEKGATVQAYISEIRYPLQFANNASLKIKFLSVYNVLKKEIPIEIGELATKTNEQMGQAITADEGALVFGPSGLLPVKFKKGKDIYIRRGTVMHVEISEGCLY